MKQVYIFHHDHYYHTLKNQIGHGIPVFHGSRQRGAGIGSIFGGIAKYALPLLMKYIVPHAKTAATSVISDLVNKRAPLKESLRTSGTTFLKNVGKSVLDTQEGGQILRRNLKRKAISISPQRSKGKKIKLTKRKKKRTKQDIFS
jgi:hypothetical protein